MIIVNYQYWSMFFLSQGEEFATKGRIEMDDADLENCFAQLVKGEGDVVVRCGEGFVRRLVSYVKSHYIFVKAAGGILVDENDRMMVMIRNGRFDLPKGKVELGETLAEAALREVNEETGISDLTLGRLLTKTYHIYDLYGGWHFKQTSWYIMKCNGNVKFVPQIEEGITDGKWMTLAEWKRRMDDSYATMKVIAKQVAGF